ncbi:MAG: hypothetical protein NT154_17550 [Verrucomicrobia bacterium]|nr:hypothetical protein [Verrucomicrobiota bacterium]
MTELIQIAWSPFCIVQRRILEFSGARFNLTNIPSNDRSLVWRLTRKRYYNVPIIRDGKSVIFELGDDTQVIGKYLDAKFRLGLFPWELEGVQSILWQYIENQLEGIGFKLNDIYWQKRTAANSVRRNADVSAVPARPAATIRRFRSLRHTRQFPLFRLLSAAGRPYSSQAVAPQDGSRPSPIICS